MPNWRTIEETDLAANVSQSEIDTYRADGALDGSDPVRQLLVSTVDAVRGYISCNGSVRMGPSGTIPRGLVIPAMDYAMGKVLNRIGVPLSEDRREALRKAQELFEKIAKGEITPESYSEDGEIDESTRPATSPIADDGPRRTLGGGLWSIAAALLTVLSASAKTFDVDISTGRPAASNEAFYHGETIEFRAVRGRSVVTNIEYSCIWYTTNNSSSVASGEGGWWKTDGLVFHPTNDCGAAAYRFFLEGRDEIGRDWHANGLLRFLPSPGFEPSAVQLPVQTLDFSKVTVINPPWSDTDLTPATNYTDEAVAAQSAAQSAALADATNALSAALSAADAAVSRSATNYTDSASAALSATKQDKLPYPTNAIPQGAVSGLSTALAGKLDNGGGTLYGSLYFEGEDRDEWDFINLYNAGAYPGSMTIGYKTYDRLFLFRSYDASYNMTTVRLPADKDGTVAFTSDIPNISGKADKADVAAAAVAATNYTDEAIGAAIANTNPAFSNAVLSVGLGIDTNTVAAINALVEAGDDLPIGGATSVGALLLALAAAVAALKRTKADASALRYAMPAAVALVAENDAATLVCADRAVTNATIASGFSTLNLTFPAAVSGYVRDFYLRITVAAGESAPALSLPQGVTIENAGGAVPVIADGEASAAATTLVWFSETAPGIFTAKSETVKAVA